MNSPIRKSWTGDWLTKELIGNGTPTASFEQRLIAEVTAAETAMYKSPCHALFVIVETGWLGAPMARVIEPSLKLEDAIKEVVRHTGRAIGNDGAAFVFWKSSFEPPHGSFRADGIYLGKPLSDNDSDQLKVVVNSLLSDAVKVNDPLESGIFSRMFMSDPHVPEPERCTTIYSTRLVQYFMVEIALRGEVTALCVGAKKIQERAEEGQAPCAAQGGIQRPF